MFLAAPLQGHRAHAADSNDQNRPLLQVADPLQRLKDLYEARDPLYRETAHLVIETGRPSVASLVSNIMQELKLEPEAPPPA